MSTLSSIRRIIFPPALLLGAIGASLQAQTAPASGPGAGHSNPPRINLTPNPGAASIPSAASPAGTADIHDLHGLAPLTFWERNGTLIMCGTIGGIIVLALILWLTLRKKPKVILTPYQQALRKLDSAKALAVDGQDKAFASAVSDVVRVYLEKAYRLPALERTTEEFLVEAARHTWLRGELSGLLQRFLEFCDLAKFAGQQFGSTERDLLLGAAREFLDAAEKHRQQPPAPPANKAAPLAPPSLPPAKNPPKPTLAAP